MRRFRRRSLRHALDEQYEHELVTPVGADSFEDRSFAGADIESMKELGFEEIRALLGRGDATAERSSRGSVGARAPVTAAPVAVQAKLEVSVPGDPLEQEADRVADHVMRGAGPAPSATPASGSEVQRACAECEREDEMVMRKSAGGAPTGGGPTFGSGGVSRGIAEARAGGGEPLPGSVRDFMEPKFGEDFGGVRVHRDERASELARGIQARAFTVGEDLFFREGTFEPGSEKGQRLLAHELTHVVQQRAGVASGAVVQRDAEVPAATPPTPATNADIDSLVRRIHDAFDAGFLGGTDEDEVYAVLTIARDRGITRQLDAAYSRAYPGDLDLQGELYDELSGDELEKALALYRAGMARGATVGGGTSAPAASGAAAAPAAPAAAAATPTAPAPAPAVTEEEKRKAEEKARARAAVQTATASDIERDWKTKRETFIEVASDPNNKLSARQMGFIWANVWAERQNRANAQLKVVDDKLFRASSVNYAENMNKFRAGARGALGPEYEALANERDSAAFMLSDQVGVFTFLEARIDAMKEHLTLQQVNQVAFERAKSLSLFLEYMAPIIYGALGATVMRPPASKPAPQRGSQQGSSTKPGNAAPQAEQLEFKRDEFSVQGTIAGDSKVFVRIEPGPDVFKVTDIFRGGQPKGSGGDLLAQALREVRFQAGKTLQVGPIENPPTQATFKAGGDPASSVLGKTVENALDRMGIRGVRWEFQVIRGKLNIIVKTE